MRTTSIAIEEDLFVDSKGMTFAAQDIEPRDFGARRRG
jgi:hypothetical protein